MDPSSLIFVAIVAIWGAYLLGHWVRRRDQLATLRSVDRFSDAMRVLERRPPTGLVQRRDPRRPDLLRPRSGDRARAGRSRGELSRGGSSLGGSSRGRPVVAQAPRRAAGRASSGRRVRAGMALATLLAVPVSWGLFAAGLAPWWAGVLSTSLFVAVLGGLRSAARRRQQLARRRADRARRGQAQARRAGRRAVVGGVVAEHRARAGRRSEGPTQAGLDDHGSRRTRPRQDDRGVDQRRTTDPAPAAAGRGWQPVPVPPPTYTLKARAPYPPTGTTEPSRPAEPGTGSPAGGQPAVADSAAGSPVDDQRVIRLPDDPADPADPADPERSASDAVVFDLNAILERRIASSG